MRLPELWIWLDGVPSPRYMKMMADTQNPIGIRDLDYVSSDRSYFSLPGQEVIPRPPSTIFPSTPEPSSTRPDSTASILSPNGNLLNLLQFTQPPIYCDRDVRLPESVRALRERLAKNFGHGVIPNEFKSKIESLDPDLLQIPEAVFKQTQTGFADQLWERILKIYRTARESQLNCEDENRWAGAVVHPILEMTVDDGVLIARSVQAQPIDPKIQPRLHTRTKLAKKVDFVLGFNPKNNKVYNPLQSISHEFPDLSLGLTKNPFIKRVPTIAVVEVKPYGGDEAEGYTQLVIGLASLLERNRQLQKVRGAETQPLLPVIGVLVIGHTWSIYVGFRAYWGENERTYVEGPIEQVSAGTRSIESICRLVNLMHRISTYAEYVYWPWFATTILNPLTRDGAFH